MPLFNVLGFEFSLVLAAVLAYSSGWRACGAAHEARTSWVPRRDDPAGTRFPGGALLRVTGSNLLLCVLPLVVIASNSVRVPTCNWSEGLRFYALFALPGILYGSTLGYAIGLRWSPRAARSLFVLWSLATYAWALWNVLRDPPIFAYNAFVAFFPGPVYDRLIPITPRLITARGIVVLEAALFAMLASLLWDGHRLRLRALLFPWTGPRSLIGGLTLLSVGVLVLLLAHAATLGLRIDRATIQRTLGGSLRTEHCDIYYDVGSYTRERAAELGREHEFHYAELRRFFGFEPPDRVGSYVYASPEQKKRLMGAAGTNFEDAFNDEFHINAARFPHPVLRHEMAHIFAAHLSRWWPICPLIGVHEGIAVAAEWRGESASLGMTPDEACVAMDSLGVLPDLRRTMTWYGFWSQASRRVYTAAGSFVHYLVERYGMERFTALWSQRDFAGVYGRSLEDLLQQWRRDRLDRVGLTPAQLRRAEQLFRPPGIFAVPCAHEQARLQSAAARAVARWSLNEADSLYRRLFEVAGEEPALRLRHTQVLMRARRFTAAHDELLAVLDEPDLHAVWRGQALARLGDSLWNLGDVAGADTTYATALELVATRDQRRALLVARVALADSSLEAPLREYLTGILPNEAGLALLAQAMAVSPGSPLPRYLMGRRLYFAGRFDEAARSFEGLERHPALPEDAQWASLELRAWSLLRGGRARAALEFIGSVEARPAHAAHAMLLEEIEARARWEAEAARTAEGPDVPSPDRTSTAPLSFFGTFFGAPRR